MTPSRVRSLMQKWEKVVLNPKLAMEGKFDSSLIPKRHQNSISEIQQEVTEDLENTALF
jgi:hypothetical protein